MSPGRNPLGWRPLVSVGGARPVEGTRIGDQRMSHGIFCVDSAPEMREYYALLTVEGHGVQVGPHGPTVLEHLVAAQPSVVIIELIAERHDGRDLLLHLRQDSRTHAVPVIVVSTDLAALADVRAPPECYRVAVCLAKPVSFAALLQTTRALITGAHGAGACPASAPVAGPRVGATGRPLS